MSMTDESMYAPTLAGFTAFLQNVAGIPTTVLPSTSPVIPIAYQVAFDLVNSAVNDVGLTLIYQLMVYNLGTSNVLNFAPDITVPPASAPVNYPSPPAAPNTPYFQYLRTKFGTYEFVAGVIESSSDNGTGEGIAVPDSLRNLSLADLQYLKDPYGRQYLAFAQKYGTAWGLT